MLTSATPWKLLCAYKVEQSTSNACCSRHFLYGNLLNEGSLPNTSHHSVTILGFHVEAQRLLQISRLQAHHRIQVIQHISVFSPSHMSYHTDFTQNSWCVYQGWWKHFSFGQTKYSGGILGLRRGCMKILEFRTSEVAPAGYSGMIQQTLVQRSPSLPELFCRP